MHLRPWPASAHLPFDALNAALKAAGEATRLRILALLAEAELTVSDLTEILRQSQPRISRHLQAAGRGRAGRALPRRLLGVLPAGRARRQRRACARRWSRGSIPNDAIIARDRERLAAVRAARAAAAQDYFRAHAAEWDRIRKLHVADEAVEEAIRDGARRHGRSARCSISAPAPGACSNCSARRSSAASASICRSTCCARARAPRPRRPAPLQRAPGRHLRSRAAGGFVRRRHHPSGAALPRRRRARDPRGRARAARRAAGCWWSISRRTISNSCATSTRIAGSASPPETVAQWIDGRGPRHDRCTAASRPSPAPTARSRCRSGSAAIRASCSRSRSGRWRDERRPAVASAVAATAASASRSSSSRRRPRRWRRRCGSRSAGSRRSTPNFVSVTYGAGGSTRERTHATVQAHPRRDRADAGRASHLRRRDARTRSTR